VSCCESADLDEVVGEDAVSAPGSGSVDAGEFGAVPAVASFDVVDPSFGSGPPFDLVAEGAPVFELAACGAGFGLTWDRHAAHTELKQVTFDRGLAVAAVGGDRTGRTSSAGGDALDRRGQLRGIGRVADLDGVVEDDPVGVVDDLGFVAELDRLAQAAFADRAGIDIVQADQPGADSGITPANRLRVWATTCFVRLTMAVRSLIARCSRALRCPAARRSARRALRITTVASRRDCSATPASSPVMRRTAACA
jgi:hypothetical protein